MLRRVSRVGCATRLIVAHRFVRYDYVLMLQNFGRRLNHLPHRHQLKTYSCPLGQLY